MAKKTKKGFSPFFKALSTGMHHFGKALFFLSKVLPAAISIFLAVAIYHGVQKYLYADPYFRLDRIVVKTDLPFTTQEIERMSGLRLGENLIAIDLRKVARRIEREPRVKLAQVKRILPNTIEIEAVRRFEVFQIRSKGGNHFYAIDDQGTILPKTDVHPLPGLVLIEESDIPVAAYGIGNVYPSKNLEEFNY